MKPPRFDYIAPETLDEVLDLLGEHGDDAKIIAGGQSLVPLLSMRLARPALLIDVNGIKELSGMDVRDGNLVVGAMTREREAERSDLVASTSPVFAEALPLIGHVSIRNRGTVGGSLAHADASAELPAVALATDAELVVRSREATRVVPADEFFVSHFTTSLAADECLVEVRIPKLQADAGWSFQEVARRHGDFALVGVAAMIKQDDGHIDAARICLMGVSDRPVRAHMVEAALRGASVEPDTFENAAADAVRNLEPGSDMHGGSEFRRHIAAVTVRRALSAAAKKAGGKP